MASYPGQPPAYSPRKTRAVPAVMRPMLKPLPACPIRFSVSVSPITMKPARLSMFMPKRMSLVSTVTVDFDPEEIKDEPIDGGAVDFVGGIGRPSTAGAPEHGLPQCRFRRTRGRPIVGSCDPGRAQRVLALRRRKDKSCYAVPAVRIRLPPAASQ